jgi:protein-tyrosine phosphatase
MIELLFVCTANRFRSPLATYYFNDQVQKNNLSSEIFAESAGTWTRNGLPATKDAQRLAEMVGIDLSHHRSREVSKEILQKADVILVMEAGHKEAIVHEFPVVANHVYLLSEAAKGIAFDIPDPYMTDESPGSVAHEIIRLIGENFQAIIKFIQESANKA